MSNSIHAQVRTLFQRLVEKLASLEDRCRAEGGVNNLRIGIQESVPLMETGEEKLACDILVSNLYEADFLLDEDLFAQIMALKQLLGLPGETWRYLPAMLPGQA